jgi:hypothetical protein
MGAGRSIEGFGDGSPPVDDQRLLVGVGYGQAAYVERLVATGTVDPDPVDPAEHQRFPSELQVLQPTQAVAHPDVALRHGLEGAAPLAEGVLQHGLRRGPHGGQPLIRQVHMGLLGQNVGVRHTANVHFAWSGRVAQATSTSKLKPGILRVRFVVPRFPLSADGGSALFGRNPLSAQSRL